MRKLQALRFRLERRVTPFFTEPIGALYDRKSRKWRVPHRKQPVTEPERKPEGATRLVSLDAFRGTVMFLMLAEAMRLHGVASAFPGSAFWRVIGFNTDHVEWQGCSLHDLIQPAFSFLVGAALPFSIASRKMKGQAFGPMLAHAVAPRADPDLSRNLSPVPVVAADLLYL